MLRGSIFQKGFLGDRRGGGSVVDFDCLLDIREFFVVLYREWLKKHLLLADVTSKGRIWIVFFFRKYSRVYNIVPFRRLCVLQICPQKISFFMENVPPPNYFSNHLGNS